VATEKWVAGSGQGLTFGAAFGSELNSLASGNAVLSSVSIANGTPLDIFCDVSINLGSVTPTGVPYVGIYLYPLNEDGTHYGDNRFTSTAAGPPSSLYLICNIPAVAAAGVVYGNNVRPLIMPPGTFKFVCYNGLGVAFASSANTIDYRTYNRSIA
jgi:hypothetical protein